MGEFALPDVKPLISFFMQFVIFIAERKWRDTFLQGLRFSGCSILISPANIKRSPISCACTNINLLVAKSETKKPAYDYICIKCRELGRPTANRILNLPTEHVCAQRASDDVSCAACLRHTTAQDSTNLPRWGTLLQYGRADVTRMFASPTLGNLMV
jgi:hypothetical protein